jgi:hypothetical protein
MEQERFGDSSGKDVRACVQTRSAVKHGCDVGERRIAGYREPCHACE